MEFYIDEVLLNKLITLTSPEGELAHKGLCAILGEIALLGYLFRGEHKIVLQNEGLMAEFDDDYAAYLDRKAAGMPVKDWGNSDGE